jgi:hypothetical protein
MPGTVDIPTNDGAFGLSVRGIEANWIGLNSDNLRELNQRTATGLTLELAARSTWTGSRANEYGFNQCEEVSKHGTPGNGPPSALLGDR